MKDRDLKGHLMCTSSYMAFWKGKIIKMVNGSGDVRDARENEAKHSFRAAKVLLVSTGHMYYISAQTEHTALV